MVLYYYNIILTQSMEMFCWESGEMIHNQEISVDYYFMDFVD